MASVRKTVASCSTWFGAGLILALAVSCASPSHNQEQTSDINEAETMWADAWTNGDKDTYRALLADEFTWTYVTGQAIDKEQAIEALNPFTIPEQSKTINVYGNTAVVYGTATLNFRGRPITERFVRIWVRKEAGWQVVLFQATEIL
jgi:ketosteroid isomerase-like protein